MKTKIKSLLYWQRALALFALAFLVLLSLVGHSKAQTITEGFYSDQPLQRGMIVKQKNDEPSKIEMITRETANEAYGIVIAANDTPITISDEGQEFFVATVGTFEVLVSTQNGPVNRGDYVSVSAIDGIGMAASQDDETVVGIALSDFDASKDVASTTSITKADGQKQEVAIGRVELDARIGLNPHHKAPEPDVPTVIQRFSTAIAGKQVNPFRAYVSVVIFIMSTTTAASLLYSGVRTGLVSLGRNPLSRNTIVRGMFQVIITGLIVFFLGLFGVYLILRI